MPPPSIPTKTNEQNFNNASEQENGEIKKKLDTPLAAMLPSKYADVDVTELFPDFRHGKVNTRNKCTCIVLFFYNWYTCFTSVYYFN